MACTPCDGRRSLNRLSPAELLGIGAAAARAGITERALRYYQQLGLLTPAECTTGGTRRYTRDDLDLARESPRLLQDLRATVEAKQQAIDGFLTDLDARIGRSEDWLGRVTAGLEAR
jgi:DNA-binding transcriptional MerR regulator